jgi:PhnB protein
VSTRERKVVTVVFADLVGFTSTAEFYKRAFGAKERMRMPGTGDTIGHTELDIGDSVLMLSDPFPQATVKPPEPHRRR